MKVIAKYQKDIEQRLQDLSIGGEPRELYEPISYTLSLGGKRIRPVLMMMACELFGSNYREATDPALGIEIFHNFTLLHDDIMDKAPIRRNQPTVHQKWDENIAILSGDAMFVKAYELIAKVPDKILREVLDVFSKSALIVCEGQQLDMNYEKMDRIEIPDYLKMIEYKTATLIAASLKIGALIGNSTKDDAENIYNFGINVGIAFQLMDDLLDTYGDQEKFGKKVGGDILSNKKTFLLSKAFEVSDHLQSKELQKWLKMNDYNPAEKITAIRQIFDFLNIREEGEKVMQHYFDLAQSHLDQLSVSEERKQPIREFTESLMFRQV